MLLLKMRSLHPHLTEKWVGLAIADSTPRWLFPRSHTQSALVEQLISGFAKDTFDLGHFDKEVVLRSKHLIISVVFMTFLRASKGIFSLLFSYHQMFMLQIKEQIHIVKANNNF